jgi:DNA-directed RNA polymerase subunit F
MESVKDMMNEIDSEEGMTHFQEITYNYVNKFSKMSDKDAKKIQKLLMDKYDLEEVSAINIVNISPLTVPELRIILQHSYVGKTFNEEQLQEILYQIEDLKSS